MKKYRTDYTEEELKKALRIRNEKAESLVKDPGKWSAFKKKAEKTIHSLSTVPGLGDWVDDVVTMVELVDAYVKRTYTDIPFSTILSIVAALIYVVSPINIIPDFIPLIGHIDDAAVIYGVIKMGVGKDLEKYRSWQEKQREKALLDLEKATGKIIKEMLEERRLGALVLGKNGRFKILAVKQENLTEQEMPWKVSIRKLTVPVEILKGMYLESDEDYLKFLNAVLENTKFRWSPVGMLRAIKEDEIEKYGEYFSM